MRSLHTSLTSACCVCVCVCVCVHVCVWQSWRCKNAFKFGQYYMAMVSHPPTYLIQCPVFLVFGRRRGGSRPGLLEFVSLFRQRASDVDTEFVRTLFLKSRFVLLLFLGELLCLVRWRAHCPCRRFSVYVSCRMNGLNGITKWWRCVVSTTCCACFKILWCWRMIDADVTLLVEIGVLAKKKASYHFIKWKSIHQSINHGANRLSRFLDASFRIPVTGADRLTWWRLQYRTMVVPYQTSSFFLCSISFVLCMQQ